MDEIVQLTDSVRAKRGLIEDSSLQSINFFLQPQQKHNASAILNLRGFTFHFLSSDFTQCNQNAPRQVK
jgi:hypothetical protein